MNKNKIAGIKFNLRPIQKKIIKTMDHKFNAESQISSSSSLEVSKINIFLFIIDLSMF